VTGGVDEVRFDGDLATVWSAADLQTMAGVENPDGLNITSIDGPVDDHLIGTDGDDYLSGMLGSDTLDAAAGNDDLYAGDDADLLIGGTGNDRMFGGDGSDTYRFSAGFGADRVYEYETESDEPTTIIFDATLDPADLVVYENDDGDLI
jgi:Ca2+-binding RTX toxin-like protein